MTHATPASEKLSVGTKLAYGSGDLGTAISAAIRGFFLLFFLTDIARIDPAAAGVILLINRFWDAINDPFVGWLSDHTVTRWGRRRPWLLFGAIPFGLFYFLLWYVPPVGATGLFVYYTVLLFLLDTTYTVINVPYTALTPELTRDYDERTSLNSYRFAFSVGGALVAAFLQPIIVGQFENPRTGYMAAGALWAVVSTLACFSVFFFTRERPESMDETKEKELPYLQQLAAVAHNRPYFFVIALYLCSWLALQLVQTVLIYYMTYYMHVTELIPWTLLAIQGTSLVFLFVWGALSRRLDKRLVYIIGACIWLAVQMALFFITPEQAYLIIPLAMIAGAGVAVAYLIPWAMMPDVIEVDEWETGMRREGIFYGFMVFLQKAGIGVAIFLVGQALAYFHYITPTASAEVPVQPESALWAIRFFIGPVPSVILIISLFIAWYYPITRSKHAQLLADLEARRAKEAAEKAAATAAPVVAPV
jgi:glycoside/pentoside/hexuronide:cation symporter, GPH family